MPGCRDNLEEVGDMRVFNWKLAITAMGAVLALNGSTGAQDEKTVRLGGSKASFGTSDTMTLGGQGTVESAASDDLLTTRHGGGFGGGDHGGGWARGGWGHRGWGWGYRGYGYGRGWGGIYVGLGGWGRGYGGYG